MIITFTANRRRLMRNNNQVALSTTFTQNGQTKTVGAIDLQTNNFFNVFLPQVVDSTGSRVAITAQAQSLPQMNGAGMVRDMRAAASLDGVFAASATNPKTKCVSKNRYRQWPHFLNFTRTISIQKCASL